MPKVEGHKDLVVWQRSMSLVEAVYRLQRRLPPEEQWVLSAQIRRAAISVPSNIAEGGRQATGEYRHHLSISRGSLLELETQLILSQRLGYLSSDEVNDVLDEIQQISRMLATLVSRMRPLGLDKT
ncbi:MAG: four helix bundle protein [Bacteroidota bacterium]